MTLPALTTDDVWRRLTESPGKTTSIRIDPPSYRRLRTNLAQMKTRKKSEFSHFILSARFKGRIATFTLIPTFKGARRPTTTYTAEFIEEAQEND